MKRRTKVLAGLSVLALIAVASCGDDDDNATTNTTTPGSVRTATTTATTGAATTSASSTATTGSPTPTSGSTETTTGASAPEREVGPGERHVTKDEGKPVKGGTLRYGLEADKKLIYAWIQGNLE